MREIKFKFYNKRDGFVTKEPLELGEIRWNDDKDDWIPLQFTGLKDRNGKRIYQGDKIKDEAGNIGEVDWDGLYASFYLAFPDGPREIDGTIMQWGEVVGNIYELVPEKTD